MNNKGIGLVEILLGVALAMMIILLLAGCEVEPIEPTISTVQIEYSDFNLVVDSKTKIVYIDNKTYHEGYHIYTPYYSENGKLCKFDDGVMREVEE